MSEWWDKIRRGVITDEGWGISISEPACRVLHRIARSGESQEELDGLEGLFRELSNGVPARAKRIRADIPLYKLMGESFQITVAIRGNQLGVERITRLPVKSAPRATN